MPPSEPSTHWPPMVGDALAQTFRRSRSADSSPGLGDDVDELLAGLGIVQLTESLDDPRLASAIRRMGLDVVRAALDRMEARNQTADLAAAARPTAPGDGTPAARPSARRAARTGAAPRA